ncbi:MAG: type II toxin-antitoxin system RelE/ParE family toxin [Bacteroidetes bacterium]|nr:MAG: type II toxin-antitoxin system RelE/ParE family toxin [Bacteroidota bacterium]
MAKRVIWSLQAHINRKEILQYWNERNKSNHYSRKLNEIIENSITQISIFPKIGIPTDFENVRCKTLKDYRIFYKVDSNSISILSIWDCRRNPDKIEKLL